MQGPLVSLPPPSTFAAPKVPSSSFLTRLKRATKRQKPTPKPSPVASGLAAHQLISAASTAARRHMGQPERPSQRLTIPDEMNTPSPPDSADEDQDDTLQPEPSPEEQLLQEWRHYAQFEISVSSRAGSLY